jgi:CubicO group peptidase (beta-lactamase class C family)
MLRHIRLALVTGFLACLVVAGAAQQQASIDARVAAALDRHHLPGAVAIAVNKSAVIYRQAFGVADPSTGGRMTPDVIFRIASMTKPVTSVAAMQLVEQGRVSLDDPAAKYLSEFQHVTMFDAVNAANSSYTLRPAKQAVTVRHLLTHTSGLAYNFTSATIRDFKPRAGDNPAVGPLIFEPGERWHYGTSTDWVGRLVERVSGQKLDRYFAEHIFEPLGMRETFFNVPADKQPRVTKVSRRKPDGTVVPEPTPILQLTEFNGGGGLFSTADDYARFVQMLLNGGTLGGARILSAASVTAMSQNQIGALGVPALKTAMPERSADFAFVDDGRDKWGLGFLIAANPRPGKRSPGSLSWGGIYNTHFWIDPTRGIGGILLMQYLPFADPSALDVLDAFERALYEREGVRGQR